MTDWSSLWGLALFLGSTIVIAFGGWRMTTVVDRLADRTGLGEAVAGAVFLGASTSLSGIVTSVTAAAEGHAEFAVSHAIGGIAMQTAFLAIADMCYREANLEHAAASPANLMSGVFLLTLLALLLVAIAGPRWSAGGVHPATPLVVLAYVGGLRLVHGAHVAPLWHPQRTRETRADVPGEPPGGPGRARLWAAYAGLAAVVGCAGWAIAYAALALVATTGLSETVMGGLITTFSTSLPELVTSVAAVRRGALTLAVGGIIGGNAFDTLLVAIADVAYRPGSVYHAAGARPVFLVALTMLLVSILLLGLLRREKHGIANIGFESVLILLVYTGAVLVLLSDA